MVPTFSPQSAAIFLARVVFPYPGLPSTRIQERRLVPICSLVNITVVNFGGEDVVDDQDTHGVDGDDDDADACYHEKSP